MKSVLGAILNSTPAPFAPTRRIASVLTRNNKAAELDVYGAVSTMFAIVGLLSEAVAATDWKLYRKRDGRGRISGGETRKEVEDHQALRVWNRPNKFMSRQFYVETVQQHMDLVGEGWGLIAYDGRFHIPMELWPVRPDKMNVVPDPEEFIAGYWMSGPDGEHIPFEIDEVLRMQLPNPKDLYRGAGPVQSLLMDLDSVRYSAEWNKNFFLNSAEPGGIIEFDQPMSDPQFKKLVKRWNEQHRGVHKAHRVAILEGGHWKDRAFSQKDMQFVELRNVSRDIMREAYRVHKHMLGQSDDVNRANAVAADYTFASRLVVGRLERWKGMLNNQFLPAFGSTGEGVEFDYCNPVPEDRESEAAERSSLATAFKTYIDAGVDPAAACDLLGIPVMPMRAQLEAPTEPVNDTIQALAERISLLTKGG